MNVDEPFRRGTRAIRAVARLTLERLAVRRGTAGRRELRAASAAVPALVVDTIDGSGSAADSCRSTDTARAADAGLAAARDGTAARDDASR